MTLRSLPPSLRRWWMVLAAMVLGVLGLQAATPAGAGKGQPQSAKTPAPPPGVDPTATPQLQRMQARKHLQEMRREAATRAAMARQAKAAKVAADVLAGKLAPTAAPALVMNPRGVPDYLGGTAPNWALSPLPSLDAAGNVLPGTGIRKFVHHLPGLGEGQKNELGNYLPVAVKDTTTFPGSDYYEIGVTDYTQQLHADLPAATKLRGYVDMAPGTTGQPFYLGPVIVAERNRPVRVKFTNLLAKSTPDLTGADKLFLPVDTTAMGAGTGPLGGTEKYTENRAELHLHGGASPWISDGTPHQWIVPAGDPTNYKKGVSQTNVPDMPNPGDGAATYYWTNQQSGRLMFYHDHTFGMTRLNVYAGEAAGYLIKDPVEDSLIDSGVLPGKDEGVNRYGIPLIIQDKTFVPDPASLAAQDPTWDLSTWSGPGGLWYPHVYMPNQNPADITGANGMGRWDYGPWFWPPLTAAAGLKNLPIPGANPGDPETPAFPNPSLVPEAFMDTPLVNGTPYPVLEVKPKAYRFRILNAANDRMWNLSFFQADPAHPTEVKMVTAAPGMGLPANWPTDGRDGGVPDPTLLGPAMLQIGNESGFLPSPVKIDPQPVVYNYNRRDIVVLNIATKGLLLGPAERADVVVDFSAYAGKTLILYNDAPAPAPAFDTRYDYYTGDPDQTETGGAPTTVEGYGPNTRTIMQIKVAAADATPATSFDETALTTAFSGPTSAFATTQHAPILAQSAYNAGLGATLPDNWVRIQDNTITPKLADGTKGATLPLEPKAIQELFELEYGRMNATLGVELPFTNFNIQTTIPLGYSDPHTEKMKDGEVQIWKITHNGVDTHPVHFHLFDVQVINRVGWDGAVRLPDANEIGWKETVRMNPLEDIIVAMRPVAMQLPFDTPESIRPLDPTKPAGPLTVISPVDGNPITVNNDPVNLGWEYVWHCHILGHEENDFMRTIQFKVPQIVFSGRVTTDGVTPVPNATLTFSGGGSTTTDANGYYTATHSAHWGGTVTASAFGYTFSPNQRFYTDVTTDQLNQDFSAVANPLVAGSVYTNTQPSTPLAGVTIALSNGGGTVQTDAAGAYLAPVTAGWTGTITPSKAGFLFAPASLVIGTAVTGPLANQNFAATPVVVLSGQVATAAGTPVAGAVLSFSNGGGSATTDATGAYTVTLPANWTGTAKATLAGYEFAPAFRNYANVTVDTPGQNYTARAIAVISGRVAAGNAALPGVLMTFAPGGTVTTDASGAYSMTLDAGWSGTVTPSKANYSFNPGSRSYANVVTDQANQDYVDSAVVTFSGQVTNAAAGNAPVAGVTLTFTGGITATTNALGQYSITLPAPWTGTMTPSLAGYVFTPAARTYSAVTADQSNQNFGTTPVVYVSGQVLLNGNAATPLAGATVQFSSGEATTTDAAGRYRQMLTSGWTGSITASKPGYFLSPGSLSLTGVVADTANQDFTAVNAVTIYGRIVTNAVPALPLAGVTVTFSNGGGSVVTDGNGLYTHYVPSGYTGTATPSLTGYLFTPASRSFTNLTTNPAGQNFTGRAVVTVSGVITDLGAPLAGVNVAFNNGGGTVTTAADGSYTITLNAPYSGTATPSLTGRRFTPGNLVFSALSTNLAGQNFQTAYRISGRITQVVNRVRTGVAGVTLTLSNGTTAITNATGNYTILAPSGFTGTLTPSLTGLAFTPGVLTLTTLSADTTANFTAN